MPPVGGLKSVRHLLDSYWLPLYSSLYGSQLPVVICALYVHMAQVPRHLRAREIKVVHHSPPSSHTRVQLGYLTRSLEVRLDNTLQRLSAVQAYVLAFVSFSTY